MRAAAHLIRTQCGMANRAPFAMQRLTRLCPRSIVQGKFRLKTRRLFRIETRRARVLFRLWK